LKAFSDHFTLYGLMMDEALLFGRQSSLRPSTITTKNETFSFESLSQFRTRQSNSHLKQKRRVFRKDVCFYKQFEKRMLTFQHTRVENFVPGYDASQPGSKIQARVQHFEPGYDISHSGTKIQARIQNFVPWYEMSQPGTKIQARIENFVPGYDISQPGTKIQAQIQNEVWIS
jgi:hypothetical protein